MEVLHCLPERSFTTKNTQGLFVVIQQKSTYRALVSADIPDESIVHTKGSIGFKRVSVLEIFSDSLLPMENAGMAD